MSNLSRRDLFAAAGFVVAASTTACTREEAQHAEQDTQPLTRACGWISKPS